MKRRTEPLHQSTSGWLDEPHDFYNDPEVLVKYRQELAQPDLADGKLPDSIREEWIDLGGVNTVLLSYEGAPEDKLLFHIHGGGWAGGVPCNGLQGMISLQEEIGINMTSIEYGLAPEHPYPDGIMDCVHAYQAVLEKGYLPENIVLIGESAGAYYSLALGLYLKKYDLPLPGGLCLISPAGDITDPDELEDVLRKNPDDVMAGQMYAFNKWYIGDAPKDAPGLHLSLQDMRGLPPVLIQSGSEDFLNADCAGLAAKMGRAGVDVVYHNWEYMPHVFFLMPIPEADGARREIADFVRRILDL